MDTGVEGAQPLFGAAVDGGLDMVWVVRLRPGSEALLAAQALTALDEVEWVEPDYLAAAALAEAASPGLRAASPQGLQITPDDPLFSQQWGLEKIHAPGAWDAVHGGPPVIVAVVDSGIEPTHPDLQGKLWTNPVDNTVDGIDTDQDGYVDDVHGWDFVSQDGDPADDLGVGTQAAGIIAAQAQNTLGIAGLCWNCRLMAVKVVREDGLANYSDLAAGMVYAARKGARVIHVSPGGHAPSNALQAAVKAAADTYGAVIVAGAGGDEGGGPIYPAAYAQVLAVTGTDAGDQKASLAGYGEWVDLAAPGAAITTTFTGGGYGSVDGASIAAPFVSGLAGMVVTQHPQWKANLVRAQLLNTAAAIDDLNPGYAGQLGRGRVDAEAAVKTAPHPLLSLETLVNGDPHGQPVPGTAVTLAVGLHNDWLEVRNVSGTLKTGDGSVSLVTDTVTFGTLRTGETSAGDRALGFVISQSAGEGRAIPFSLEVTADGGYTTTLPLTITTQASEVTWQGIITGQERWTPDQVYRVAGQDLVIDAGASLTIEPGTRIRLNQGVSILVSGELVVGGSQAQPVRFTWDEGSEWGTIVFEDAMADAAASAAGEYQAGSLLRWVEIDGAAQPIQCLSATPFIEQLNLKKSGLVCTYGASKLWIKDSLFAGDVEVNAPLVQQTGKGEDAAKEAGGGAGDPGLKKTASPAGAVSLVHSTIQGSLVVRGAGQVEYTTVMNGINQDEGGISNSTVRAGITLGEGILQSSVVTGEVQLTTGQVLSSTVSSGGIVISSGEVRNNTVSPGSTNSVGIQAGEGVVRSNRVLGGFSGIRAGTGQVIGNLASGTMDIGAEILAGDFLSNTIVDNHGIALWIPDPQGAPQELRMFGNNFDRNQGMYDLVLGSPGDLQAAGNWWGTTDAEKIQARILDGNDDGPERGKVTWQPGLTAPCEEAPGYVVSENTEPSSPLGIGTAAITLKFSRPMNVNSNPVLKITNPDPYPMLIVGGVTAAAAVDGLAYTYSAYPEDAYRSFAEYHPVEDTWSLLPPPDFPHIFPAIAAALQKIYLIGGGDTAAAGANRVSSYDLAQGAWTEAAVMNTPRRSAGAAYQEGKIYVFGGEIPGQQTSTVEAYDPQANAWSLLGELPYQAVGLTAAAGKDGRVYLMGGMSDGTPTSRVEEYDTRTNTWRTRAEMPRARAYHAAAVLSNGTICALGGRQGSQPPYTDLSQVDCYYPDSNRWSYAGNLKIPRVFAGGAGLGGYALIFGGRPSGAVCTRLADCSLLSNESFTPARLDFYDPRWSSATQFGAVTDINALIPAGRYFLEASGAVGQDGLMMADAKIQFTILASETIHDTTAPLLPTIAVCAPSTGGRLSAEWTAYDLQSSISLFRFAIGSTPEADDIFSWTSTLERWFSLENLGLRNGQRYYISVRARNGAGLWGRAGTAAVVAGSNVCRHFHRDYLPRLGRRMFLP
jgi:subtilisin family serine protease